ncbi:NADP-dependent 3-hydroxy acid dehydrogenase YdfG [Dyadobacter sp. SG02]|uniref:short chain dehydrogenase n=1 Tax=Dyadobacter sp. SG02 TaxID=1855291 RepID=UPI0008BCE7B1|nr:short chain dehydrogenase [Dyadobacter sp. SG02]SEJ15778.1 NADP-dependent 3-hydroxy acid dehydrogenase YdfG [Dyadobacter sp. SG02]
MKRTIIVFGASGTIGTAVSARFEQEGHQVVRVGRSSGDYKADITDVASMEAVFKAVKHFDAIANAAGDVASHPLEEITDESIGFSIGNKMLGQVNLVRTALPYIADKGAFALISGVLTNEPILGGVIGTMVNGAVEGFVKAAAHEMPRGIRINCISPTVLAESPAYHPYFPGFVPVAASQVAIAYERAIFGIINGRVISV